MCVCVCVCWSVSFFLLVGDTWLFLQDMCVHRCIIVVSNSKLTLLGNVSSSTWVSGSIITNIVMQIFKDFLTFLTKYLVNSCLNHHLSSIGFF